MTKDRLWSNPHKNAEVFRSKFRGKNNLQENERCHACGQRNFNGMDDEDSKDLLLDWEKEPDYLMKV